MNHHHFLFIAILSLFSLTQLQCTPNTNNPAYTVGGNIFGLSGSLVLQNNGSDSLTLTTNGTFAFATRVSEGAVYNVTVLTQPAAQACTITNASGTMGGSNVTNVNVSCSTHPTTLSSSVSHLALAMSGNQRTITITNTGSNPAQNLSIQYPLSWPSSVASASSNCGNSLGANDTCTITVVPGSSSTSDCGSSYSSPTADVITVNASNLVSSVTTNVYVLTYGCIYEEGYIFAIDDTTPTTTSIGGTTAGLGDHALGIPWHNGSFVTTNAQSMTDGAANTAAIISAQGPGTYAAEVCTNYSIDSSGNIPCSTGTCYDNWYLPAICQMGASGEGGGCSSLIQNIVTFLVNLITSGCSGLRCLSGLHWSSTEYAGNPQNFAWFEGFSSSGSVQLTALKSNNNAVRCARDLIP